MNTRAMQAICCKKIIWTICLFVCTSGLFAQDKVEITGRVVDSIGGKPVPYVMVATLSTDSDSILAGTTTDDDGRFFLETGTSDFYLKISFIGFRTKIVRNLNIADNRIRLGDIVIAEKTTSLDEVQVTAERSTMEFKLDKRVFNVGKDLTSTGMGALEVLDNIPSVNVDIEGQISLRGNTGVQILINGKPSVIAEEGSQALGSITADMIEKVEVITNPSAKYDAEGSSGIINIVLKKEEKKNFNGSLSINAGTPDNHSLGASLNQRTENFNFFTQFGAGYRSLPSYKESLSRDLTDSTEVFSHGTEYRNENFFNITLGTDYHMNQYNVVTLSGSFAYEEEEQPSSTEFMITDGANQQVSQYKREETTTAGNPKYQYDLQYEKKFRDHEDHVLQFSTLGKFFGKEQSSEFSNIPLGGILLEPDQRTQTNFFQRDFIYKLDYADPLSEQFTVEAGAQYEINDVGNDYAVFDQDSTGEFAVDSNLTNNFEYNQKVLGLYATAAYEGEKWGVKIGLRTENTELNTLLTNTSESNDQNYTNLFPSFHTSYKLSKHFSLQAGYSKRVRRPRLWDLNPFFNIRNNYNVRRGNPNLKPEFSDSYELTSILVLKKASINASIYHLYTTDVIERVSVFENNVNTTTPENIGTKNQTGLELNGKWTPNKWLVVNGDFNYGYFVRNGSFQNQVFDFTGDSWSGTISPRIKLPAAIEVEMSGGYNSRYKTVQGEAARSFHADAGLRKKLWKGKAVINLSIRDIFESRGHENTVDQPDYYLYSYSSRGRFMALGFSYSFGKGEAMSYTGRRR